MKHYKKPDGSVWAFEVDGSQDDLIESDMTAVADGELDALRRPELPRAELLAQTLAAARQARAPIMGVLDGMQASALTLGNTAQAQVIEAAKQGLRDLTKIDLAGAATQQQIAAAIYGRYQTIAAALPPALRVAFAQVAE